MSDTEMDADAIVVGGGLNGPLAALALAHGGMRTVLLDARPLAEFEAGSGGEGGAGFDGRSYALNLGAVRMLRALGLWEALEPGAQPITGIRASDGRPGEGASPLHLRFDAGEIGEPFMGQMVEDRHLRPALLAACAGAPLVDARYGVRVTGQEAGPGAVTVETEAGPLRAPLLLGCDGRGGETALRAGLRRERKSYRQTALVCAVRHERPHGGVAHQLFLPAGPLAILPLRGDRASVVWTEEEGAADSATALDDAAYLDRLRPRFGSFLGDIALEGARHAYPLSLSLASDLAAPRVALVGDAAHGIHPIAGQGLNLGMKDVAALAHVLGEARRRGEDIGGPAPLAAYARWRRFDVAQMAAATDAVNALFSNDDPVLRGLRRLGLGAVDAMTGLKRRFIREAAGLTGELPELMRTG
jgi:2-octaprenyl-6-methoxyphenol hydroxylase